MKGLHLLIYQNPSGNFSNGGISSRCKEVTLVGPGLEEVYRNGDVVRVPMHGTKIDEIFEPSAKAPAVVLVKRIICGRVYVHCEPLNYPENKWMPMCGGTLVSTSDSRFKEMIRRMGYDAPALSFHDRFE